MSRLERQRWQLGEERWPKLQRFLSEHAADALLGDPKALTHHLRATLPGLSAQDQAEIASECWDFMAFFKDRYDDWRFLRDGFGIRGKPPMDNGGQGQMALARVKLVYDALAEAVRGQLPEWKPVIRR